MRQFTGIPVESGIHGGDDGGNCGSSHEIGMRKLLRVFASECILLGQLQFIAPTGNK